MIDYYIGLKGAQNMSEEEATNYANTLAQQLKISDDNVIVRSTYFNLKDENHGSDMLFYFLIGFVTFIGSGIVIYSIFYISVASSIRNYGQLRTIGTTKRQIKKMVYREGKLLAAIAIPIGLVIGNVIGYFLIPVRLVLADYFMCDGRGWPFCIYYCDDCHSYSCKKSCGSISAGSIAIFRLSGENERKFRVAP
ncbi:MAG: ABC transporter permease [Blautia producta]